MLSGLTPSDFEAFVRLFCPKAAAEGVTIIARSGETGEMIRALLTEDSASEPPQGMDRLTAKFNPIFDILGQLDDDYRGGRAVNAGESMGDHSLLFGRAPAPVTRRVFHFVPARLISEVIRSSDSKASVRYITEKTRVQSWEPE